MGLKGGRSPEEKNVGNTSRMFGSQKRLERIT